MSPLADKQFLFVVGAPRSGTTWLHHMLMSHPDVAGLEAELTTFTYLGQWNSLYRTEKLHMDQGHWKQGAPLLYTEEEFAQGLHAMACDAYNRVLARKPHASHILDKHPGYARHLPLINKLFPNSKIIHIIRDGREVAVSMMSAKRRLGFGAGEIRGATAEWVRNIRMARAASSLFGNGRYMEVRYEELRERTEARLRDIFRFAGIDVPDDQIGRLAAANDIRVKQVSSGDKELNALRDRPGAIWKTKLSLEERWIMDRMAGDLLLDLCYAQPGWWATKRLDPLRMGLYRAKRRILNTVGSALHAWKKPLAEPITPQ